MLLCPQKKKTFDVLQVLGELKRSWHLIQTTCQIQRDQRTSTRPSNTYMTNISTSASNFPVCENILTLTNKFKKKNILHTAKSKEILQSKILANLKFQLRNEKRRLVFWFNWIRSIARSSEVCLIELVLNLLPFQLRSMASPHNERMSKYDELDETNVEKSPLKEVCF